MVHKETLNDVSIEARSLRNPSFCAVTNISLPIELSWPVSWNNSAVVCRLTRRKGVRCRLVWKRVVTGRNLWSYCEISWYRIDFIPTYEVAVLSTQKVRPSISKHNILHKFLTSLFLLVCFKVCINRFIHLISLGIEHITILFALT